MSRKKRNFKQKEKVQIGDQKKQEIFKVAAFLVDCISKQYFESVKKTKELIPALLESTRLEAGNKTFKYNPGELDERDLYCLQEINRQTIYEHYGQHQRILSNAILISTYSALEYLLSTVARYIGRQLNEVMSKNLYLSESLEIIARMELQFDKGLIGKIHTLRKVRNILVHANGECAE